MAETAKLGEREHINVTAIYQEEWGEIIEVPAILELYFGKASRMVVPDGLPAGKWECNGYRKPDSDRIYNW